MTAAAAEPAPAAELSRAARTGVLAATVLGSSLSFIDGSVVNVALPAIQKALSASGASTQWVVNAYLLLLGSLVLIGGSAADRFGRRRVFALGVGLFALASLACAAAPGVEVLIAARALQGLAAALATPASLALLDSSFPEGERAKAIGLWAGAGALTTAAGPVLGGWLVDTVSWRAIFLINLPVAAAAIAIACRFAPESRDPEAGTLDLAGAATAALGLGAATWALTAAPDRGLGDPQVVGALALGTVLLAGFLALQAKQRRPMMPLSLFKVRAFSVINALTLCLYAAMNAAMFLLPFELIRARGYPATAAGAMLLPFALIMGLFSSLSGKLADRIGPRAQLTAGPILAGAGLAMMGMGARDAPVWATLLPAVVLMAVGMTLTVGPLTAAVMGAVDARRAGLASGVNNAVARVAGLIAVAAAGGAAHAQAPEAFHAAFRTATLAAGLLAAAGGVVTGLFLGAVKRAAPKRA